MLEIKKIETARMENGSLVITDTQWGLFLNGHEWGRYDTEAEAIIGKDWMASDEYQRSV